MKDISSARSRSARSRCGFLESATAVAGSFRAVEQAFRTTFENVKPQDCVIAGMFPRFRDEVAENAGHVRRILGAVS